MTLPKLPPPDHYTTVQFGSDGVWYRADQMRDYGQQCRDEALEEAAKKAESHMLIGWRADVSNADVEGINAALADCADAIRALIGKKEEA